MKKTLIITGASKGIGYATAKQFHDNQWQIINLSRTPCPINNSIHIKTDLSTLQFETHVKSELSHILVEQQQICLLHNAAYHLNDTILNQEASELTKALQVSIISPAVLNQLVIPFMGPLSSILYVGSTLSEKAVPNAASYVIAKHATVGMMRATCQDLAKHAIHSACICPGFTNTEMLQDHLNHNPDLIEFAKKKVGAERLIAPDEIAAVIYFAALHPVMNGAVLHANLGQIES